MEIKTFDNIVTGLVDDFNSLLPEGQSITSANTNIYYLFLKAISKGYEVIQNTCVLLQNKFDPERCDDEDLLSTAKLVGTEKYKGQPTGLQIVVGNTSVSVVELPEGTYTYEYNDDYSFKFTLTAPLNVPPQGSISVFAVSDKEEALIVDAKNNIEVTLENGTIPESLYFNNLNNKGLQGYGEESTLAFRKRINSETDRQDILSELEHAIKNLPEIYDCRLVFNQSIENDKVVGKFTIPPMTLLVMVKGTPGVSLAEEIVKRTIYPTVSQTTAEEELPYVSYKNDIFADGEYKVYYDTFGDFEYTVKIDYIHDSNISDEAEINQQIINACEAYRNASSYTRFITEDIFYNIVTSLNIPSVKVLNVTILVEDEEVPYLEISPTEIGKAEIVPSAI